MSKSGRPAWVPDLDEVERLAARGLTREEIAFALGISEATLYARKRADMKFSEALKKGRALGIRDVADRLYESAMAGNTTALIFYLKARAGWRDQHVEVDTKTNANAEADRRRDQLEVLRAMTSEERQQLNALLERGRQRLEERAKAKQADGDAAD
jgi:hypothetical protein